MNATQQHMLDLYRASQHRALPPPPPGAGEWQAVREFRTLRDFRAVVDEKAAARRARWTALPGRVRRIFPQRAVTAGDHDDVVRDVVDEADTVMCPPGAERPLDPGADAAGNPCSGGSARMIEMSQS
ncbi:hypothetical protein [Kitasatospora sp. GP82]|uniref:hypothetical protein n=1 Tax=Kitasatospora sp. GP82 TaxID=3035089 RepID=UPI00247655CA|nr:hypothetical protein [Kitasatospora sp. GP82]MDH6127400.1 hypothetical protein [Kitasatospora sp. GP82]